MNDREAVSLGRWCARHNKQFRRVPIGETGAITGCPDCIADPDFREAMENLVRHVIQHEQELRDGMRGAS